MSYYKQFYVCALVCVPIKFFTTYFQYWRVRHAATLSKFAILSCISFNRSDNLTGNLMPFVGFIRR